MDLLRLQLNIARGEKIPFKQEDIVLKGHAIECRVNAEDPESFIPCPGEVTTYVAPGGRNVQVDSAAYTGYKVPPFYDSMIAKLITWGDSREEAIKTMDRALDEYVIEGIKTNIPLHKRILHSEDFKKFKALYPVAGRRVLIKIVPGSYLLRYDLEKSHPNCKEYCGTVK